MSFSVQDDTALLDVRRAALEASEKPVKYTWKDFSINGEIQTSAKYRLTVLDEAVKRPPEEFRQAYPNFVWRKVAGLRDIRVHEDYAADLELIWQVINEDVRTLESTVSGILKAHYVPFEEDL